MMKANQKFNWKQTWALPCLILLLSACGTPLTNNSPSGNSNGTDSSDGRVMVENRVYTEAEARSAVTCYKNSQNEAARLAGSSFETSLNAAIGLKSRGLNIQYEGSLQALIQAMLLFDRGNNNVDCIN
ncbi:MAG: hypothetical protein CVV27_19585 [Candidatus Melainabacteria bacterium HGW-Melainabacteria-1]|nr:MAG: hypothetical protein CVV27_19585 [Candidatus Melainabacteria bacterium HGW-Melainabacteria-1]